MLASTRRNLRKRIKAKFHNLPPARSAGCAETERTGGEKNSGRYKPAIFAFRFRRKRSKTVRLAISANGRRLPPYIRFLLQTKKRPHAPPMLVAPCWPYNDRGLQHIDQPIVEFGVINETLADFSLQHDRPDGSTALALTDEGISPKAPCGTHLDNKSVAAASSEHVQRQQYQLVSGHALELLITEAVKAVPSCEAFMGVIVEHVAPQSSFDTNWDIRGVRFGRTDRTIANAALVEIVIRMKREFKLLKHLG